MEIYKMYYSGECQFYKSAETESIPLSTIDEDVSQHYQITEYGVTGMEVHNEPYNAKVTFTAHRTTKWKPSENKIRKAKRLNWLDAVAWCIMSEQVEKV